MVSDLEDKFNLHVCQVSHFNRGEESCSILDRDQIKYRLRNIHNKLRASELQNSSSSSCHKREHHTKKRPTHMSNNLQ